ncbi:MAG: AAA family ATPase [Gammaproteobacteria bacterium]|nr:AAA family ATPase [Gammaproteobacteria bacterium]MBU1655099.1 AAA family ATPase [Gammaproteobacteria bacterium]MBU1961571.1 AAA family ATPase [Gammaproteobacteria bacterium]
MVEDRQAELVRALRDPARWPRGATDVEVIETHISTVFLAGEHAYKLKKPLNLGFLDFSTLDRRRFCCEEEIRLNRRLAPSVYLRAIPVTGTPDDPHPDGQGEPIDWLVEMRRFDAHGVLSERPRQLNEYLALELAHEVAEFHRRAEKAPPASSFGEPERVLAPMLENFAQLRRMTAEPEILGRLGPLEDWTRAEWERLTPSLRERREQGHVRECHGDLHLGNILVEKRRPLIFDGIEFAPELRWIDTLNDLAFLLMDLHHRNRADLANMLLNAYLAARGDYRGLPLLPFYLTYRAMVRAKVTAIRLTQPDLALEEARHVHAECLSYLALAETFTRKSRGCVVITHGLSGCGKSTLASALLLQLPLARIRTDVERKRLAGIAALQRSDAEGTRLLYGEEMTRRTYAHVAGLARAVVEGGGIALIDAAFLKHWQRELFARLAADMGVIFLILDFQVPEEELRRRIKVRRSRGTDPSDADLAVLERQIREEEPLDENELAQVIPVVESAAELALAIRFACQACQQ